MSAPVLNDSVGGEGGVESTWGEELKRLKIALYFWPGIVVSLNHTEQKWHEKKKGEKMSFS